MRHPIKTARERKNIKSNDELARQLKLTYEIFDQDNARSLGTKLGELDRGKGAWWRNRADATAKLLEYLELAPEDLELDTVAGPHLLALPSFPEFPPLQLQRETIWQIARPRLATDGAFSAPSRYHVERTLDFWLVPGARGMTPSDPQWLTVSDDVEFEVLTRWLAAASQHGILPVKALDEVSARHVDQLIRVEPLVVVLEGSASGESLAQLLALRGRSPLLVISRHPLPELPEPAPGSAGEQAKVEAWTWTLLPNWRDALLDWIEERLLRLGTDTLFSAKATQALLKQFDRSCQWFARVDDVLALCQAVSERRERKLHAALDSGTDTGVLLQLLFDRNQSQLRQMQDLVVARWSCWSLDWSGPLTRDAWSTLLKRGQRIGTLLESGLVVPHGSGFVFPREIVPRLLLRAYLMACMNEADVASWALACFDDARRPLVDAALDGLSDGALTALARAVGKSGAEPGHQGAAEAVFAALGRRLLRADINGQVLAEFGKKVWPMLVTHKELRVPVSRPWHLPGETLSWVTACWSWSLQVQLDERPSWQFPAWNDALPAPAGWLGDFGRRDSIYSWERLAPQLHDFLSVVRRWLATYPATYPQTHAARLGGPKMPLMFRMALLADAADGRPHAEPWWWWGIIGDTAAERALLEHVMPSDTQGCRSVAKAWWPLLACYLRQDRESNKRFAGPGVPLFSRQPGAAGYSPVLIRVVDCLDAVADEAVASLAGEDRTFLANHAGAFPPSFQCALLKSIGRDRDRTWQRWEAFGVLQQYGSKAAPGLPGLLEIPVLGDVAASRLWEWNPQEAERGLRQHAGTAHLAIRHLLLSCPDSALEAALGVLRDAPQHLEAGEWRQWALARLPNARRHAPALLKLIEIPALQVIG